VAFGAEPKEGEKGKQDRNQVVVATGTGSRWGSRLLGIIGGRETAIVCLLWQTKLTHDTKLIAICSFPSTTPGGTLKVSKAVSEHRPGFIKISDDLFGRIFIEAAIPNIASFSAAKNLSIRIVCHQLFVRTPAGALLPWIERTDLGEIHMTDSILVGGVQQESPCTLLCLCRVRQGNETVEKKQHGFSKEKYYRVL
jgi:hypothetical protein